MKSFKDKVVLAPVLPGVLIRQRPKSLLKREQKSLSPAEQLLL